MKGEGDGLLTIFCTIHRMGKMQKTVVDSRGKRGMKQPNEVCPEQDKSATVWRFQHF